MIGYIKRLAGPFKGDGRDTVFSFSFKVFSNRDIYVATADEGSAKSTILAFGSDYTVRMNDDQDATPGGSITLSSALPVGKVLSIVSNVAYTQEVNLTNYSRFPPSIINQGLDRLEIQIQQLKEKSDRHLAVPETSEKTPEEVMTEVLDTATNAAQYAADAKVTLDEAREVKDLVDGAYADVSSNAALVTQLAGEVSTKTDAVLALGDKLDLAAAASESIQMVAGHISDVHAVGQDLIGGNIESLDLGYVKDQADPINDGNISLIGRVLDKLDPIETVADGIGSVAVVATEMEGIKGLADNASAIGTVAEGMDSIKAVLPNTEAIKTVANLGFEASSTTLEPNAQATATATIEGNKWKVAFGIPRGVDGVIGRDGAQGKDGEKGEKGDPGVYVGSDTPEGYTVYVDPTGDPDITAEDIEWKLDRRGGTMTGNVTFNTDTPVKGFHDGIRMGFFGATSWDKGAHLLLNGKDSQGFEGWFELVAHNGTSHTRLEGHPDGVLTWDGKEVERIQSSGADYIRYENGVQICWGVTTGGNQWGDTTVTFPLAFVNADYGFSSTSIDGNGGSVATVTRTMNATTTKINVKQTWVSPTEGDYHTGFFRWIAIGRWR